MIIIYFSFFLTLLDFSIIYSLLVFHFSFVGRYRSFFPPPPVYILFSCRSSTNNYNYYYIQVSIGLICGRVTHILWPIKRWQSIANKLLLHQVDHLCGSDDHDCIGLLDQQQLDILNHLNDQYDND